MVRVYRNKILVIIVVVFTVRLFLSFALKTYQYPVAWEYEEIANNLVNGNGFLYHHLGNVAYRSFNTPLYSFLCAALYIVFNHSFLPVLFTHFLFSSLLAITIFYIGKRVFNEKIGFYSALLTSLHPAFIYYDVFNLIPLSIDAFFISFALLLSFRLKDSPSFKNQIALGAIIGLGTLSRGIIAGLLPFLIIWIIFYWKDKLFKHRTKIALGIILANLVIVTPWIVRGYLIHKKPYFICTTTSELLWHGNNPYATGTSYSAEAIPIFEAAPEEFKRKIYSLDEIGQKELFEKEAWYFIKKHPLEFIKLYFKKIYYFWWFSPQSGILYPEKYKFIYKLYYTVLLLFFVLGFFKVLVLSKNYQKRQELFLITSVIMAICLFQSLFYCEGRHRWIVEPLLIIFSLAGINYVLSLKNLFLKNDRGANDANYR